MSQDIVNLEVNGVAVQGRKGQMIIQVTDAVNAYVPRFCYHETVSYTHLTLPTKRIV